MFRVSCFVFCVACLAHAEDAGRAGLRVVRTGASTSAMGDAGAGGARARERECGMVWDLGWQTCCSVFSVIQASAARAHMHMGI